MSERDREGGGSERDSEGERGRARERARERGVLWDFSASPPIAADSCQPPHSSCNFTATEFKGYMTSDPELTAFQMSCAALHRLGTIITSS